MLFDPYVYSKKTPKEVLLEHAILLISDLSDLC